MQSEEQLQTEAITKRLPGESVLDYTQRIRQLTVDKITQDGIPIDNKDLASLSMLLDSMDKQEINKARIIVEDKAANVDKHASELIKAMATALGNDNPYLAPVPVQREIVLDEPLPEVTLVDGELDQSCRQLSYDTFMKDYREKNPKETDED